MSASPILGRIATFLSLWHFSSAISPHAIRKYDFPPDRIDLANSLARDEFPASFKFGVSTSSYQNEGAWNVSEKGPSAWDYMLHRYPEIILDSSNGDVAVDFYHKYKEDIQLAKSIGSNVFRISINWPRLLPTGFTNEISEDGLRFYNDVIDELVANGLTPMVTLFHGELPYVFHQLGSFANPLIVDFFTDYAKVAFAEFGDRVKLWVTINEPESTCLLQSQLPAPMGYNETGSVEYSCYRHLLLTCASIYRAYQREFASSQKGKLGLTLDPNWYVARPDSGEDGTETARNAYLWISGVVMESIFGKRGNVPITMRERINYLSYVQGFPKSREPFFTDAEVKRIRGCADFVGFNFYHYQVAHRANSDDITLSYWADVGIESYAARRDENPFAQDLKPDVRTVFEYVTKHYDLPEIYITETGFLTDPDIEDARRAVYLRNCLASVLDALKEGYDIKGFLIWTLVDNFSWINGYILRPGLFYVDFENATLPRSPKLSSKIVSNIYKERRIAPILEVLTDEQEIAAVRPLVSP